MSFCYYYAYVSGIAEIVSLFGYGYYNRFTVAVRNVCERESSRARRSVNHIRDIARLLATCFDRSAVHSLRQARIGEPCRNARKVEFRLRLVDCERNRYGFRLLVIRTYRKRCRNLVYAGITYRRNRIGRTVVFKLDGVTYAGYSRRLIVCVEFESIRLRRVVRDQSPSGACAPRLRRGQA